MKMSEILSNVLDNAQVDFMMKLTLSEEDKKEFQMMRFEELVKRDLHELLIASASAYHTISDRDLSAYVKGAAHRYGRLPALISIAGIVVNGDERIARYQREIFLYRQVIFRIQREFARRAKARDAADPFPHAVPY